MLRGDCPAVVRRGGLEAAVDERVHDSFSPFRERERERNGKRRGGVYPRSGRGMGAFRISDIKADTASIPLKYHASVASTRDFSSPSRGGGSSTEITSKRVNSLARFLSIREGGSERERENILYYSRERILSLSLELLGFMSRVGWFKRGVEILSLVCLCRD